MPKNPNLVWILKQLTQSRTERWRRNMSIRGGLNHRRRSTVKWATVTAPPTAPPMTTATISSTRRPKASTNSAAATEPLRRPSRPSESVAKSNWIQFGEKIQKMKFWKNSIKIQSNFIKCNQNDQKSLKKSLKFPKFGSIFSSNLILNSNLGQKFLKVPKNPFKSQNLIRNYVKIWFKNPENPLDTPKDPELVWILVLNIKIWF